MGELVVELLVCEDRSDASGDFARGSIPSFVDARGEGVGPMVEHELGLVVAVCSCLDSEVAEHGIRLPSAEEGNMVTVDAGAHECGGPTRSEGASTEQVGVDPRDGLQGTGGVV